MRMTLPTGSSCGSAATIPVRTPTPDAVVSPLQYAVAVNLSRAPACGNEMRLHAHVVARLAARVERRRLVEKHEGHRDPAGHDRLAPVRLSDSQCQSVRNPRGNASSRPLRSTISAGVLREDADLRQRRIGHLPRDVSQPAAAAFRDREQQLVILSAGERRAHRVDVRAAPPLGAPRVRSAARSPSIRTPHPLAAATCRSASANPSLKSIAARAARARPIATPSLTRGSGLRCLATHESVGPPGPHHLNTGRRRADRSADPQSSPAAAPPRVSHRRDSTSPPAVTSTTSGPSVLRDVAADHRHAVAPGQRRQAIHERFDVGHEPRAGQHQRQQRPSGRGGHRRQIAQVHRQRLVANVGGRGEGAGKMHPLDHRIGSHHQTLVPDGRQDRGIIARPDQHAGSGTREARQQTRQQGVFTEVSDRHWQLSFRSLRPRHRTPVPLLNRSSSGGDNGPRGSIKTRFAVWGGLLNLHSRWSRCSNHVLGFLSAEACTPRGFATRLV